MNSRNVPTVMLGEVAEIVSGTTPKTSIKEYWDNGTIPWITPADMDDVSKYIFQGSRRITELGFRKSNLRMLPKGSVLLTSRAPIGKVSIAGSDLCTNQGFKSLVCSEKVHSEFLYYYLRGQSRFLNSLGRGATFKEISKRIVERIQIPLPPLEAQKKIAVALDQAQELIDKRQQQIGLLDEFLQSVFLDMFGDPVSNPKGYSTATVSELSASKMQNGFFAKNSHYSDDGNASVVWISDFIDRMYCKTEGLRLVNAKESDIEKYRVCYGDILFCRSSLNVQGIGKASCVPLHVPENTMFECHVIKTTLDISQVIPEFFQVQSPMAGFRGQIMRNSKTATMTTISQSGVGECSVVVPPLDRQREYVSLIKNVSDRSVKMEESLSELQTLFQSIMQKAFRGELFT